MIRVHLGPMRTMLAAVLKGVLQGQADMEIVGCSAPDDDGLEQAYANAANVIVIEKRAQPTSLGALIAEPLLGFVAIAGDGLGGTTVHLARDTIRLWPDANAALADAIRQVAARR